MSSNGRIAGISGSALVWVLGFGKGNVLASDVTSGQLTFGLGGRRGWRVVHLGETVAFDSMFDNLW